MNIPANLALMSVLGRAASAIIKLSLYLAAAVILGTFIALGTAWFVAAFFDLLSFS